MKHMITRLTYNCAHLRSTKESLTDSVKKNLCEFFWVKILGEIFVGDIFLGEHFFEWKFLGEHFLGENFLGEIFF